MSLILNSNTQRTNVILGPSYTTHYGLDTLEDELCGSRFQLHPASFFQVNPVQTETLYRLALEFAQLRGDELVCEGECPGTIAFAPMGEGGFGYDPVFFVPELRKTFGQLTAEEKASVSHRGKALRAFAVALDDYLKGNE